MYAYKLGCFQLQVIESPDTIDLDQYGCQSKVPRPTTSASPANLSEMQILHFYAGYTESETLGWNQQSEF